MKIAIITGASSGIGREFARQLAAGGQCGELWLIARRKDRLQALAAELGGRVRIFAADVSAPGFLPFLRKLLQREQPEVRWLINCAGFGKFATFERTREEDALSMIDVNCRALTGVTHAALPFLNAGGHIVQIASIAAFQPLPSMAVYAASKAYVRSFSRALADECRSRGVSVTAVCPGWVDTEFLEVARRGADPQGMRRQPLSKQPSEVAALALADASAGKTVSLCGVMAKAEYIGAKLLPEGLVIRGWKLLQSIR